MTLTPEMKTLLSEAAKFINHCYDELGISKIQQEKRIDAIEEDIRASGSYTHEFFELTHGAKMAWRNSNRCIGRLLWDTLHVIDARHIHTVEEAYDQLVNHIAFATNEGKIGPTITIFPPRRNGKDPIRIWNHQLIRYAGYKDNDKVIGDSSSLSLTKMCEEMGWRGERSHFDILPLVLQECGKKAKWFEIPNEIIKEVPIHHPEIDGFRDLKIKWYAVPIISDMRLEIGGIHYPMAPFNGWYMGTEIGARNLADEDRYHLLPQIADIMGLDKKTDRSLWIDKALVELNIAVLHSFEQAQVTLVDHHTAAKQFQKFEVNESQNARSVTGDWTWLIPPVSPATTHIFHQPYNNELLTPNYFYQEAPQNDSKK